MADRIRAFLSRLRKRLRDRLRMPLARLRSESWPYLLAAPRACEGVQTMLMASELRLLEFLAGTYYRREGAIVDAGSFLGGSTVALAAGLRRNLARRRRPETALIHSFDLFRVEDWTRGIYFPESTPAGASTRKIFDRNIAPFAPLIAVHEGDITDHAWTGGPIEILFIDIAKTPATCDWITGTLFPRLIPGRSIVVQQDYLYAHGTAWLHITMEYYADEFEKVCDTGANSVAFRLRKPFARGRLRPNLVESMSLEEKIALMDRAAARFAGIQAEWLVTARNEYLAQLGAAPRPDAAPGA
jgi:hypothetical protein